MGRPLHLKFFADFIATDLGIVYTEANDFQLEKRLDAIAKARGIASAYDLYLQCSKRFDTDLRQIVRDAATNNETYFFRDPKVFDVLKTSVLPKLFEAAHAERRRVRIWSAACSYGQEPYSIAMLCRELIDTKGAHWSEPEIFATDIANHAIDRAAQASYTKPETERGLTPDQVKRYVRAAGTDYTLAKEVRSMVRFERLNLLTDGFTRLGKFDLITCRNVLIYQAVPNKTEIVRKLQHTLQPKGHLLLGAGESLLGLDTQFKSITDSGAVFFVLSGAPAAPRKTA